MTPNLRGSLYTVMGAVGYVTNDACIRAATEEGLGVYQALFLRGVAISSVFIVAARVGGVSVRPSTLDRRVIQRALFEMVSVAMFFAGLVHLDFANAQTILMITPFAVTVTAAIVLKERVSPLRYLAVVAGFVGVLLVVRPATDGFSAWSLIIVGSAALLLAREFATRSVPAAVPAVAIALVTALGVVALTGVLSLLGGWQRPTGRGVLLLAGACVAVIVGYVFAINSVRTGDLSVTAPFRYTALVWAVLVGRVAFSERMDALGLIGCGVIIAAGIASAQLERRERKTFAGLCVDGSVAPSVGNR